ncbi:hypothetical protein L218DRAFT_964030 [Marasmius fiardii PR-910]|nr:hypothetical protein L218DRAFT_964030 [Marasmius fiardii PR-910]
MAQPEASVSFLAVLLAGLAHSLVYGSNAVLFGAVTFLLRKRKDRENATFHTVSTALLFLFATITAVVNTLTTVEELGHLAMLDFSVNPFPCRVIYLVTLQLADAMAFIILLHRCFNIWEGDYRVVILPALMMLTDTALFYSQFPNYIKTEFGQVINQDQFTSILHNTIVFSTATIFLNISANVLLTLLIAGRLWWFRRRLQRLIPNGTFFNKYTSLIIMTLESGLIIPIALTIYAALTFRTVDGRHVALVVFNPLLPQIMASR